MQHVIIATVYDKNNTPRRGRRIEWRIDGPGSIIRVDSNGWVKDKQCAVSMTNKLEHKATRGNDNPADDFVVRPGQTWCVVSSPVEGDTHVTVIAPGIADWDKSVVVRTIRWVDADYQFPPPAQVRTGTEHVMTTHISRHTDKQPLAGYRVRYKIEPGGPGSGVSQSRSGVPGHQRPGRQRPGGHRPDRPGRGHQSHQHRSHSPSRSQRPSGSGVTLARGETIVDWLAPTITLTQAGPAMAVLGSEITYETTVTNTGRVESGTMLVTSPVSDALQYVGSVPPASINGRSLEWAFGTLPPGQSHKVQTRFKTLRPAIVESCALVVTEEGFKDSKCIQTSVTTAALKVAIRGPATAALGQQIQFTVTVSNPGGGPLDAVLLSANFDDGLESERKVQTLNQTLSPLAPQENRAILLDLVARKPGPQKVQRQGDGQRGQRPGRDHGPGPAAGRVVLD